MSVSSDENLAGVWCPNTEWLEHFWMETSTPKLLVRWVLNNRTGKDSDAEDFDAHVV